MARLAAVFKGDPQRRAAIEGHTDSVGGADANQVLSQRRADAVMTALVNLGVPANRLSTRGFGEDSPTASNDSAAGRQMNRRVEIVFVKQGGEVSAK
jgi:outer membrane protein OmpA-like peptidoglycan-associated protein